MRLVRLMIGCGAALLGNVLLVGAAGLIGNHRFSWNPTKVSVEWQTTLKFAGAYSLVGVVPALLGAALLRGTPRRITVAISAAAVLAGWAFCCLLVARMNPGYLWLLIGIPVVILYVTARGVRHLRNASRLTRPLQPTSTRAS